MVPSKRPVASFLVVIFSCCLLLSTDAVRYLEQSDSLIEGSAHVETDRSGPVAQQTGTEVPKLIDAASDNPAELVGPPGLVVAEDQQVIQDTPPAEFLRCGTPEVSKARKARIEKQVARAMAQRGVSAAAVSTTPVVIQTYVWVIDSSAGGNLAFCSPTAGKPDVQNQMAVLNASFAPHFAFNLVQCSKRRNDSWFRMGFGTDAERDAKAALRVGTAETLNIYVALPENPDGSNSALGHATIPADYPKAPKLDGAVISFRTLPGYTPPANSPAGASDYIYGDTAVHEVGHWLGLYHIFDGGCKGTPDDLVADTPRQVRPTVTSCPAGLNSCKDSGKTKILDVLNNFMDYRKDACATSFTKDQFERMKAQWAAYRAEK